MYDRFMEGIVYVRKEKPEGKTVITDIFRHYDDDCNGGSGIGSDFR